MGNPKISLELPGLETETWCQCRNLEIRGKRIASVVSNSLRMDCSPPGSSVHGILWARILEWVAMPSFRVSSRPRDQTHFEPASLMSPALAGGFFTTSATWEAQLLFTKRYLCVRHCAFILFYFFATPCGVWNLNSWTGNETQAFCIGRRSLNHRSTRDV